MQPALSLDFASKRTLEKDPQYFGAFLNMARHNVFLINNHLANKFKPTNILEDDGKILNSFLVNEIKEKPNYVYSHLTRLLPITKVFNTALLPASIQALEGFEQESINFANIAIFLKDIFTELNAFRNDYSHYYAKTFTPTNINRKIQLETKLAVFIRKHFFTAIEYTKKRFDSVFEPTHFDALSHEILIDENDAITHKGLAFFTCLFLEREYAFLFLSKLVGFKNTQTKEFLATREVFCAFCVNLPTDKFISDDDTQSITLDMLNYLNRCPNELFDCLAPAYKKEFEPDLAANEKMNIATNSTADELPYEDYEDYIKNITSKKRHTDRFPYFALKYLDNCESFTPVFQIDLGKALIKSYPKMILGKEENRDIVENIKVFGKLDSFYFNEISNEAEKMETVRKFINLKPTIEFSQYAPHYNLQETNKIGISLDSKGTFNGRCITKDITAQISVHDLPKIVLLEILQKGKPTQIIHDFINANTDKIYNPAFIEQIKTALAFENTLHRKFHNNKVVYFDTEVYENIDAEIAKVKNILNNDSTLSAEDKKMANEDLSSLYYWKYVENIENRKIELNNILAEHGLNVKQIPSRIVDYWLDITLVKNEITIKNIIKAEKKDCAKRMKDIDNRKAPKIGEMATYLAKDIVANIIDKSVKQKVTSFYYDTLQECLALFANPEKKAHFLAICETELQLFDTKIGHPFLNNINFASIHKTTELYKQYLIEKGTKTKEEKMYDKKLSRWKTKPVDASWLYQSFYKKQKNEKTGKPETVIILPQNTTTIPLQYAKLLKEKTNFTLWLQNVTKGSKAMEKDKTKPKAIDLSTNIFDPALTAILKQKVGIQAGDDSKYSYAKLLELWLADTQPFYNGDREYIIYKGKPHETSISFTPNTKDAFKDYFEHAIEKNMARQNVERKKERKPALTYYDVLKVFNNSITENEKQIRFYQTKDRIMLLMLHEIMVQDNTLQLQLKEIAPTSEISPLNMPINIKQKVTGLLQYDQYGNMVARKNDHTLITKTIVDGSRKRKHYGTFKKFITDKRLPELFEYFAETEINYLVLEKELREYNKYKDLIFDEVFALEEKIINSITNVQELTDHILVGEYNNVQHQPYLNWLKNIKQVITDDEYILLNVVRNAFSHNQFVPRAIIERYITLKENESITEQIFSYYKDKIMQIKRKF